MLSIEMNRLAKKAVQNPEILKPLTTLATSNSISALITSRKKPSVTSVNGRVRITSTLNPANARRVSANRVGSAGSGRRVLGASSTACADGVLTLTELQRAGGKRLPAADFLRGFALQAGQMFEVPPP